MRYPYLLDRNFERVSGLPFVNALHIGVRDALCRIADELEVAPVADLIESFDDPLRDIMHEMVLETIGLQEQKQAEFSALNHRFPLLKANPPEDFVEAAFLHFLDVLELNALEDELQSELTSADEHLDEAAWERIQALTQDLTRRREECAREEGELAERAKKIRSHSDPVVPGQTAHG
jgi:DNA primase